MQGPDLYAYSNEQLTTIRFIHHLTNCQLFFETSFQIVPGNRETQDLKCLIRIKLSEAHKRVFYLKDTEQGKSLFKNLESASVFVGHKVDNSKFYTICRDSTALLGEGTFGKVYKGLQVAT